MFRWRRPSTQKKWKLILVSHTHWDREWYLPFQQFRARLVEAVDNLLDLMANDLDYRHFMLDGQTIVLEDYLEVRPEREDELRRLIGDGRVLIGPWYVMPDEFLVSGESLVRNLLEGRRTGARFGPVMKVGYVPDSFGHIAQLPQILKGFGMDTVVLWRGVSGSLDRDEAYWVSPDGSQALMEYLPGGYGNAALLPSAQDPLMERISQIRTELQPRATTDFLLLMNGHDHVLPQPDIPTLIAEANRRLRDAEIIHGTLPMFLDAIKEQASGDGVAWPRIEGELRSSELAHLLAGVLSTRVNVKQLNAECETLLERWAEPFSSYASLLGRDPTGLEYPAARRIGTDSTPLLRLAWRYLLKNQPHDSICGCSIDQVHEEMETRFAWCRQVAGLTTARALDALAGAADTETLLGRSTSQGVVAVFNSESGPRSDFTTATVDLPGDRSRLALMAPDGIAIPWQVLSEHHTELAGASLHRNEVQGYLRLSGPGKDWPRWKLKMLEKIIRAALRGQVPDLVVTTMDVVPGPDPSTVSVEMEVSAGPEHNYDALSAGMRQLTNLVERGDAQYFRLRVRRRGQVEIGLVPTGVPAYGMQLLRFEQVTPAPAQLSHVHDETTLENDYLSLQVSPEDGSVRLIDRESGAIFWGLNSFVDDGDAGDEYTFSPPPGQSAIATPSRPPTVVTEERGPARQVVRIELEYQLPHSLTEDRSSRSKATTAQRITSWLYLYPGVPRVDVRTVVDNAAKDHRLRVLFPTHLNARAAHADGQFAVIQRSIELGEATASWMEQPTAAYPQLAWVDVSDGESGLLIANRGLREYEIVPQERGPAIALTLLRCVGWLSRDDLLTRQGGAGPTIATPGAQMQGTHTFEYSIVPHPGTWDRAIDQGYWFARPLSATWTGRHRGTLGAELSFLSVSPASLALSAVKRAEDGSGDVLVRVFNTQDTAADGAIKPFFDVRTAHLANLAEERLSGLEAGPDGTVRFNAGGNQIVTIRLSPA